MFTFRMYRHFAVSVKPTISSAEHTLMKGKSEFLANWAAKAVFPALGGPSRSTDTNPVKYKTHFFCCKYYKTNLPESPYFACCMYNMPSSNIFLTGLPQFIIPFTKKCSRISRDVPNAWF